MTQKALEVYLPHLNSIKSGIRNYITSPEALINITKTLIIIQTSYRNHPWTRNGLAISNGSDIVSSMGKIALEGKEMIDVCNKL